jgi:hypothetical protein
MVADLTYSHEFMLRPKVSTLVSLVDYQDKDRQITRESPNYVDGSFHTTCIRGFNGYGDDMYLAVPSYNPDPRMSMSSMVRGSSRSRSRRRLLKYCMN